MNRLHAWIRRLRAAPKTSPLPKVRLQIERLETRLLLTGPTAATGTAIAGLVGQPFSGIVGSFTPASDTTAADYTVTILWGDGGSSAGSVDDSFNVSGSHTFNAAGAYPVAFQVQSTLDSSTSAGIGLAVVESLTDDTRLQAVQSFSLTQSATTSQTGSDGGGAFSLQEVGTLTYTLARALTEVGASLSSTADHTVAVSVQESGSDAAAAFTIDDFTIGDTDSASATLTQLQNDFHTYTTATATVATGSTVQANGDVTTGDVTATVTASDSTTTTGTGTDGSGAFTFTTTASDSSALHVTGNYGSDLTLSGSGSATATDVQNGTTGPETYTQTQTASGTSTLTETKTYSTGAYTAAGEKW